MEIPDMTVSVLDSSGATADAGRVPEPTRPDPEVPERARRRTFTAQYKLDILTAYDAAPDGAKGALLRREGLYSSHITQWRRVRDAGGLEALKVPRGRRGRDARDRQIEQLKAEKTRLEQELAKATFVVDVQAKLHALLETLSGSADTEPRSSR
jgi:transposase-like protein